MGISVDIERGECSEYDEREIEEMVELFMARMEVFEKRRKNKRAVKQ